MDIQVVTKEDLKPLKPLTPFEMTNDVLMTSSIISATSSLTSPVDSGVQLLDSESESVMSISGTVCDLEIPAETPHTPKKEEQLIFVAPDHDDVKPESKHLPLIDKKLVVIPQSVMTKSDIANQNTTPCDFNNYPEPLLQNDKNQTTAENAMHISVSEEVNESLKCLEPEPAVTPDEQIVFRRQRKKKSTKSDTPKKRVSFHEDILNSTKIDDIHIERGFITHQPDISMSFFNWDSVRKPDVIKGRYSWAAEGDSPYYHRNENEREVKSEIYISQSKCSSTSSSSYGSVDSSSSNSLCDADEKPKYPKTSCLKKRPKKQIETQIIEENHVRQRKSESNLLDSNLFGSLKNMLSFSSTVSLAERGVPEGQEDFSAFSSNQNLKLKRNSFSGKDNVLLCKSVDRYDNIPEYPKRNDNNFDNTPLSPIELNPPIVVCDSTVYEHKGISYSYEYDKFQKSFESGKIQKEEKSSTIYQLLLKDLNIFKRREKTEKEEEPLSSASSTAPSKESQNKAANRLSVAEWSDTETLSDFYDINPKHLSSPKRKVNKANHYSVQSFRPEDKIEPESKSLNNLKPAPSKTSLINRFLRNVTMKKLLDVKLQKKQKMNSNKFMGLYLKGAKPDENICNDLDKQLEEEIQSEKKMVRSIEDKLGSLVVLKLKKDIFRDHTEKLRNLYKVRSMYSSTGEAKPLVVFLTNSTLYIIGFKANQNFVNHFVLPYTELDTILIGPNGHTIHFSNVDREMQYFISTGSSDITNDLIGQLEMAMRRDISKPKLPAVRYLTMRDMINLRHTICKQTAVNKDEEYFHYSIVNVQEVNSEIISTPLGPTKEGPLMFKTANNVRWETGYFILKGGVFYMLSSPSNRLPMQVFPLSGGACLGAHRTPYLLRPHTFELLLGSMTLQLAAPDEYVASEWLQVLVQTASGSFNNHEANYIQSCTLLLTHTHILTMQEAFPDSNNKLSDSKSQTLSCAAISDLTSFRIPLAEQSWCILEFACREVHETSGDLVIYFTTNSELERFISTVEMLWSYNNIQGDSFPLSTISETEPVNKKSADVYRALQSAWACLNLNIL